MTQQEQQELRNPLSDRAMELWVKLSLESKAGELAGFPLSILQQLLRVDTAIAAMSIVMELTTAGYVKCELSKEPGGEAAAIFEVMHRCIRFEQLYGVSA
jgi:hypothetical protein